MSTEHNEKTISSQVIYQGKVVTLRVDKVALINGMTATREVIIHGGAAAVLAVNKDKEVYFVRQYRKAVEKELLEIPAGKLDPGEEPRACAERELAEETGLVAKEMRLLTAVYTSPGFASEKIYLYLATGLRETNNAQPDEGELLTVQKIPLSSALQMVQSGEITDAKTCLALLLAAEL
ncbi:MAG: NUDIX hydrolase, partial [Firmicutes bacterium]|nr:NUDIX hydrolase [Bacillota bacterium]